VDPVEIPGPPTLGIVNADLTITFKRNLGHCFHSRIIVDEGKRTVTCEKCLKQMDPFEALGHLARDPSNLLDDCKRLRADVERWHKEADEARRLRDNAVAARKRAEAASLPWCPHEHLPRQD